MVQQVTIPLEWANSIPGVSGIEDVTFRVPEIDDIQDTVDDVVPDLDDIRTEVEDVVTDALDGFEPIADAADDIVDDVVDGILDAVTETGGIVDTIVDDIVEDLEEALGVDFPDPEQFVDDVVAELEESIPEISLDPIAIVDEFLSQVDPSDFPEVNINIEGSLFATEVDLFEFVAGVLEEVDVLGALDLDNLVGDLTEPFPDVFGEEDSPQDALKTAVAFLTRFRATVGAFVRDPNGTALSVLLGFLGWAADEGGLVSEETRRDAAELRDIMEDRT